VICADGEQKWGFLRRATSHHGVMKSNDSLQNRYCLSVAPPVERRLEKFVNSTGYPAHRGTPGAEGFLSRRLMES
jgi:hypothetical protein